MADRIDQLPPTMKKPTSVDTNAMREIFNEPSNQYLNDKGEPIFHVANKMNWKKFLVPLIVFIILSLPPVNNILLSMLSDSEATTLIVKTIVFIVIMLVLQLLN